MIDRDAGFRACMTAPGKRRYRQVSRVRPRQPGILERLQPPIPASYEWSGAIVADEVTRLAARGSWSLPDKRAHASSSTPEGLRWRSPEFQPRASVSGVRLCLAKSIIPGPRERNRGGIGDDDPSPHARFRDIVPARHCWDCGIVRPGQFGSCRPFRRAAPSRPRRWRIGRSPCRHVSRSAAAQNG